MPDPLFDDPRLAALYDPLDPDRADLDAYVTLAGELGARAVLDVGCGKPGAERVRWLHGDATTLPPLRADLVTMTGNVAQVFLADDEWAAALAGVGAALRPGGHLVLESRDPAREAWRGWTRAGTYRRTEVPGAGEVEAWAELTEVAPPYVSFRWTYVLAREGAVLTSDSTLRFRSREELAGSLAAAGYTVVDVRDAPDRPGLELVFLASR